MPDNDNPNGQEDTKLASVELSNISKQLNDVLGLLRTQRDMLRTRGVQLPSGAMENVRTLKKSFDSLTNTVGSSQQELRSLRALAETSALINSAQSVETVLNEVIDTVIALTGAERGYIVLKNAETGELEFKVARGMDQSKLQEEGMIISRSVVNQVADSGEPVLTDNATQEFGTDSVVGLGLRSILAVPLKVRDKVIGVVYCDNRIMTGLFKKYDLDVLAAFANQAGVAIDNANLFESARLRLDEVTETRNRMDSLFTSIASGVITINEDDVVIISNHAAHDIVNTDQLGSKPLFDVIPENEDMLRAIKHVHETGENQRIECEVILNNSRRIWSVNASPLRGNDGTKGIALVIDDMTEQKKSETQIMEARRYLPVALVESMRGVNISEINIEERQITALFADVRGFTSFSERLEPEELMTVINKYLSLASDSINLFEGIVDKYMGDAVTGLFNTQLNPQHDHPTRAVQAAMQLVMDLHAMHEVLPESERLFYGIGIHTGDAVLGNVGGKDRREFSALGESTDICKYLQEQAGPGEIIISGQVLDLVKDTFICELAEVKRAKKGYEHIECYVVRKRKKGTSMFVDEELLALLADDDD